MNESSQNQQQSRNRNYSPFRTNGSLVVTSISALCCLLISIAGISGLVYSSVYFNEFQETTATVVGRHEMGTWEHSDEKMDPFNNDFGAAYCPEVQFFTVGEANPRNITTVLEFNCKDYAEEIELGEVVDILYDPSDPEEVLDASVPTMVEVAMICVMAISAMCSCCYVVVGIFFYRAINSRNKRNGSHHHDDTPTSHDNHHSAPSLIQMTTLNENSNTHSQHATGPNEHTTNTATTSATATNQVEPPPAVPFTPLKVQPQHDESPPLVPVYPEGTPAGTAIAAGDEAPPIVGCTLIPSTTATTSTPATTSNESYVSPSSVPAHQTNSSYVSPANIDEATASA